VVSGTATVSQATGTNLHTVVDSGTITTVTNPVTVTDGAGALNVIVDSGTVAVTGPLTDTQLRASAVPVSLASVPSHAVTQGTSPWIVAGGGTAGAPGTAVLTVQGIGSGTAIPISGSVSVSSAPTTAVTQSGTWTVQPGNTANTTPWLTAARISKAAAAPLSTAVSVGNTATLLPASVLTSRVSLCVYNNGAATMFIGTSGVTTVNGLPLPAGGVFCDDVGTQPYYGIVAAGTVDARVLEN
jgi:hypothetical protein